MHPDVLLLQFFDGRPAWLYPIALAATLAGSDGGLWLVLGLGLLVRPSNRRLGVRLLVALILVLIAVEGLKLLIGRPRPFLVLGPGTLHGPLPWGSSFPSGHATGAFAGAATWRNSGRRGRVLGFIYAAIVSWSRLYLGAHWPSDVLAGALIGLILAFIAARVVPGETRSGGAA